MFGPGVTALFEGIVEGKVWMEGRVPSSLIPYDVGTYLGHSSSRHH
jgi:hypothetical protein